MCDLWHAWDDESAPFCWGFSGCFGFCQLSNGCLCHRIQSIREAAALWGTETKMDLYHRNTVDQNRKQHSTHGSVNVQSFTVLPSRGLFSVNCPTAGFWTPLHAHRVHDQVLFFSIRLHCSLVLILLCICYVKRFGPTTHCWRWGCLWHLTAQRGYSQSFPLWTASAEEIHLQHRKHFVTAVFKICRPQFSLSVPVSTPTYHSIITIFAVLHCHEVFLYIDRCSEESSKLTF